MNSPRIYAEWLPLLDQFRAGDNSVLDIMWGGSIEWTNIVAERWTHQITGSLTSRLQTLSKELQTSLDRARGDYFAISNALLLVRRELSPLRMFVSLPALPSSVKNHLTSELNRWATGTQTSLERHAEGVRHDQGRLLKTIRDHPLTTIFETASPLADPKPASGNPPVRARRIIL